LTELQDRLSDALADRYVLQRELDPLSTAANSQLGAALVFAGRPDEAITRYRTTLRTDPSYGGGEVYRGLAGAYLAKRMYREAIAVYQEGIKEGLVAADVWGLLGYAYAFGRQAECPANSE
jgi:tetratricopeptide (TPR) repeat protein